MGDKEIHTGQAAAAERGIHAQRVLPHGLDLLLGDVCRDVQFGAFVLIFRVEGVEFLRRRDLADGRRNRLLVAQHRTLDLMPVDKFLDQHLAIQLERLGQAGCEFKHIVCLGNADRRTLRAGLDEHRERAERIGRRAHNAFRAALKVVPQGEVILCLPHAGRIDDCLGDRLIHRVRACRNAAADIRDIRQFKQALYRAVLAAHAVQHREHAVDTHRLGFALVHQEQAMDAAVGREHGGHFVRHALPRAIFNTVGVAGRAIIPLALPRDANRINIIFILIQIAQNRRGGQARDLMFTRNTAE